MNTKGRNNKSLCENSMKMVTNIVRLSSLSIAKRSLETSASPPATKRLGTTFSNQPQPQFPQSLRSQEPKLISFLIHPAEGNEALSMIREEEIVDEMASDYIRKVHDKNRNVLEETSKLSAYIMPPPPHAMI